MRINQWKIFTEENLLIYKMLIVLIFDFVLFRFKEKIFEYVLISLKLKLKHFRASKLSANLKARIQLTS